MFFPFQTIRAEDNGGKFSNATLNVEVGDANDQVVTKNGPFI